MLKKVQYILKMLLSGNLERKVTFEKKMLVDRWVFVYVCEAIWEIKWEIKFS